MSIGRGTTPTITFNNLDMDLTNATVIYITFAQNGKVVLEKTIDDVQTLTAESMTVKLAQADTLALNDKHTVEVQIRAGFSGDDGDRVKSNIMTTDVERILKDGEI